MATWKQVILKDPVTGEYLAPLTGDHSGGDANTLQGHPASDFVLKSEYTPVDLSEYLKTATADTKYAAANHNHNGVYAPVSHTHSISQITGLQSELNSLKSSVSEGKSLVAAAVTDKGVTTAADATFQTIADNIGKLVIASGPAVKQYMTKENVSGHYMTSVGWEATASGLTKITDCLVALVGGNIIFWAANGNFVFTDSTGNETPAIGGSAVKVNGNVFTVQPGFITKTVTVYAIFLEIDGHNAI